MPTNRSFVQVLVGAIVAPYLVGYFLSPSLIAEDHLQQYFSEPTGTKSHPPSLAPGNNLAGDSTDGLVGGGSTAKNGGHITSSPDNGKARINVADDDCDAQLEAIVGKDMVEGIEIHVHHNGYADPCGSFVAEWDKLLEATQSFSYCADKFSKYDMEALFTTFLRLSLDQTECEDPDLNDPLEDGILGFCDRGVMRTPILSDHDNLVKIRETDTYPCHFHSREGLRMRSFDHFKRAVTKARSVCNDQTNSGDQTCEIPAVHLYAVPAGRLFMLAPKYVGETFEMDHVIGALGKPISLTVLSVSPRVLDVHNFFSRAESADLVTRALAETSESHRIKRSTTGAGTYNVNNQRTSESGFDTSGKTAQAVKRRCFETLGMDTYIEGHSDGLQILRYNKTTAYIPHMDYIDDPHRRLRHNYDSAGQGGNRLGTIILYMSDLKESDGGETVFTEAWPVGQKEEDHVHLDQALAELRSSGDASMLKKGSWEESMVAKCRSRLAVRPQMGRAVLFYSQHPNGEEDKTSLHGGCPVLHGEKWAANLWFWNTIRDGFDGNPVNLHVAGAEDERANKKLNLSEKKASFYNMKQNEKFRNAVLYFKEDKYWAKLGFDDPPAHVNTYEGHEWTLKVDGEVVKKWLIGTENAYQFQV